MSLKPTVPMTTAGRGIAQADLAGRFVYKFDGNALRNNIVHRICGIGQFTLDAAGQLSGSHTSSGMPLQGSVKTGVLVGTYVLTGKMLLGSDASLGDAHIAFTSETPGLDSVDGKFRFAIAGAPDRLWLMSTGATIMGKPEPINIAELVIIEAIRIAGS